MTAADDQSVSPVQPLTRLWIFVALFLGTLLLYLPVRNFDFVNYDDPGYITSHELVQRGLTWEGVKFAFTGIHLSNWHPLTTLSHMATVQVFGLDAGWHHLINVLIHALNVALLFVLLHRVTGDLWPSAAVATLLAAHPLHVESVAWISERKDVLCLTFWLLTTLAYARWVEKPCRGRYAALVGVFALGIMTKAMIVTLPCALLLMDAWPLRRLEFAGARDLFAKLKPLVLEKLPLFALAVFLAFMTVRAQQADAIVDTERLPLQFRLANAVVAWSLYLLKAFWPVDLAVFYPHPGQWAFAAVTGALLAFVGLTVVACKTMARRPWIGVGWFWYVGTLTPVIGLVQVGDQAVADRYAYVPLLGIYLATCWEMAARLRRVEPAKRRPMGVGTAGLVLLGCVVLTSQQIRHWRNSETLFRRALAVTENNDIAHNNLATFLGNAGRLEEAGEHFLKAYEINPHNPETLNNLSQLARLQGDVARAARFEAERLAEVGGTAAEHLNLAQAFAQSGRLDETVVQLESALRVDPDLLPALNALVGIRASHPEARLRDGETAMELAGRMVRLSGGSNPVYLDKLAMAQAEAGDFEAAAETVMAAIAAAESDGQLGLLPALKARMELYQGGRPFRMAVP